MPKRIPLTQGKFAIVDDEDYEWLNQWKWYYSPSLHTGYAVRGVYARDKCTTTTRMHRQILNLSLPKQYADHINGNGLDNRRQNLRVVSPQQNAINTRKRHSATSKYKGVSLLPSKEWKAAIILSGESLYLGSFQNELDAARAYDSAAHHFHGDLVHLNLDTETPLKYNGVSRKRKYSTNTSGYRGVGQRYSGKWYASISVNGKSKWLGTFDIAKDAAMAYDKAAREIFGPDCAFLNFRSEQE